MARKKKKLWIQSAIKRPGALRRALGVSKKTGKIAVSKIRKAAKAGGRLGRQARLALTLRKLRRRKGRRGDGALGYGRLPGF